MLKARRRMTGGRASDYEQRRSTRPDAHTNAPECTSAGARAAMNALSGDGAAPALRQLLLCGRERKAFVAKLPKNLLFTVIFHCE